MPRYDFYCQQCDKELELKMSFDEHAKCKDELACISCGDVLIQKVAPLNFKLAGNGWFGKSDTCVDAYGITEMETRQNLDMEKRIENEANELSAKDKNQGEF